MKKFALAFVLILTGVRLQAQAIPETGGAAGGAAGIAAGDNTDWTGTNTFLDTKFFVLDDGDPTKKVALQVSGVATGTTRTLTIPNADITVLSTNSSQSVSADHDFTGFLVLGGASEGVIVGSAAAQSTDTVMLGTGSGANSILVAERGDAFFDFAHPQQTNPTLFIHSANQSTTQWLGLTHAGTKAYISTGTGHIVFSPAGSNEAAIGNSGVKGVIIAGITSPLAVLGWTDGASADSGTTDTTFSREGAGIIQMGEDVNGAAVSQTFKAADAITGSNVIGAALTLSPGKGTGSAVSGSIVLNRTLTTSSGTTAQTQAPSFISCPTKILSNTSATAQTIATITTTTTSAGSIELFYTTTVSNGTTLDADSGMVHVSWNNVAGTVAGAMTAVVGQSDSDGLGTLATTPTATVATNVVSIKYTPTWTVITPTVVTGYATFHVNSINSVVCN